MYKVINSSDIALNRVEGYWLVKDGKKVYIPGIRDIGKVIDFENETVEFPMKKLGRALNRVMTKENSK